MGRLIDGVYYEPLPGEWGISAPLTISGPDLVLTKSGPATLNLGQPGDFSLDVQNVGSKTIKTPAGKFEAIGIRHQTANSKRTTTLWCVEELDYLPVLIEQHRRGELTMQAKLRRYAPSGS